METKWLLSASGSLANAKRELVYAITAFERTGGDFNKTISNIKQVIGDLECAVQHIVDGE